jgi:chaperonin GroEL
MVHLEPHIQEKSDLIVLEGGTISKGYSDASYIKEAKEILEFESPLVLVSQIDINSLNMIVKPLEFAKKANRPLVIVAPTISKDCHNQLLFNVHKNIIQAVCIEMKTIGDWFTNNITDLAVLFNATEINQFNKDLIDDPNSLAEVFGEAKQIHIGLLESTFMTKEEKSEDHMNRIEKHTQYIYGNSFIRRILKML